MCVDREMHDISLGVAIVTYNGANRVAALLNSLEVDRPWIDEILVSEDLCPYPENRVKLQEVCDAYQVRLRTAETWGCMQGTATRAMEWMSTDVVALLSDDVLATPGCIRDMR